MKKHLQAEEPETSKESWTPRYQHMKRLAEVNYEWLKARLTNGTIAILDADEDLLKYMEDAKSGDSADLRCFRGACYGAHSIMSQFYTSRITEEYGDLPDTAARHILVGGDTYFEHSPRIDCVGNLIGGVLQALYDLLDNEHPERKVEFALQPAQEHSKTTQTSELLDEITRAHQ